MISMKLHNGLFVVQLRAQYCRQTNSQPISWTRRVFDVDVLQKTWTGDFFLPSHWSLPGYVVFLIHHQFVLLGKSDEILE